MNCHVYEDHEIAFLLERAKVASPQDTHRINGKAMHAIDPRLADRVKRFLRALAACRNNGDMKKPLDDIWDETETA